MSYVFENIDEQLNGGQPKQNVFQNDSVDSQGMSQGQDSSLQKTSTEGQISANSLPKTQSQKAPVTPAQRQSIINYQSQSQKTPGLLKDMSSKMDQAKTSLQDESNKYVQGYETRDYREGADANVVKTAVEGSNDSFNKIRDRLTQAKAQAEEFKPQTNTQNFGVEELQTRSGLKSLFQKENAKPQYSQADSAFDAMLLARNPEFRRVQQELEQKQKQVSDYGTRQREEAYKRAQEIAQKRDEEARSQIRGELSGYQSGITGALQKEQERLNADRSRVDKETVLRNALNENLEAAMKGVRGIGGVGQRISTELGIEDPMTLDKYLSINNINDYRDLASKEDASRFNRVSDLLGTSDYLMEGKGAGSAYNLDQNAVRQALIDEAIAERQGKEKSYRDMIEEALDYKNRTAMGLNEQRQRGADFYASQTRQKPLSLGYTQEEIDAVKNNVDANQFYEAGDFAEGGSVFTPEERAQMQYFNEQIGNIYDTSKFGGSSGKMDQFQYDAYQRALQEAMNKYRQERLVKDMGTGKGMDTNVPQQDVENLSNQSTAPSTPNFTQQLGDRGGKVVNNIKKGWG
jgi:hypothetical protein